MSLDVPLVGIAAVIVSIAVAMRVHSYERGTVDIDFEVIVPPWIYVDGVTNKPREASPVACTVTVTGRGSRTLFAVRPVLVAGTVLKDRALPVTSALSANTAMRTFSARATGVDAAVHVAVYAARTERRRSKIVGHRALLPGYEMRECEGRRCWWASCPRRRLRAWPR